MAVDRLCDFNTHCNTWLGYLQSFHLLFEVNVSLKYLPCLVCSSKVWHLPTSPSCLLLSPTLPPFALLCQHGILFNSSKTPYSRSFLWPLGLHTMLVPLLRTHFFLPVETSQGLCVQLPTEAQVPLGTYLFSVYNNSLHYNTISVKQDQYLSYSLCLDSDY